MSVFLTPLFIESLVALPLVAALVIALRGRQPASATRWTLIGLTLTLVLSIVGFAAFLQAGVTPGHLAFSINEVNSPMLPVIVFIHLLTMLGTAKARITWGFCVRLLISAGINLAMLTVADDQWLMLLLSCAVALPLVDLFGRGQALRGMVIYSGLYLGLLWTGWYGLHSAPGEQWPLALVLVAVLVRGGILPVHGWVPSLFQKASFGAALLYVLPMMEALLVLRLLTPTNADDVMHVGAMLCLATAVYGGGMAIVQAESRRFFSYISLSQSSLVLFGVLLHSSNGVTAALCLWISAMIALSGLAFSLRALEARFGTLSLREHHGFYQQVPGLAICFIITGLASVGFPGTIGFVPMELLISGSVEQGLWYSLTLAVAAMLNAIALMRAYFALFTGRQPRSSISLLVRPAERLGIAMICVLVFLGGWFSPAVIASRHAVAQRLLGEPVQESPQ